MTPSPELATIQRALSSLYIEVPETIAKDVERAFNAFLAAIEPKPADLWVGCYCARCGQFTKWPTNKAQHGRRYDDYKIVHNLCDNCFEFLTHNETPNH